MGHDGVAMTMNRRALIRGSLAVALSMAAASRQSLAFAAPGSADAQLASLLQKLAEDHLRRSPEEATAQDFDIGAHASLRRELDDRSLDAIATFRKATDRALAELARIDRASLSPSSMLDLDVATFVYATLKDTLGRFGFVDINLRPSPYVVSQMNGAYYWLPEFLGSRHPLQSASDLDAYFARLNALPATLDAETDRIRHDAALGVILPDFTLATTIAQVEGLLKTPPERTAMIGPAMTRAANARLGDISTRAGDIFRRSIVPALTRQANALRELKAKARSNAGVWALPDGEAYYATAVHANTTVKSDVAELHRRGLQLVEDITAQLDSGLKRQGYSNGSVVARIHALDRDPRFLVSDDDAGRERLLSAARTAVKKITALLPAGFRTLPNDPLEVRRIPAAIESGAPGAFYSEGGGGTPAAFSLNLKTPSEMPLWRLPTLAHHEGIPGHHFQAAVLRSVGELPLFRKLVRFSAYTEGWALYAERVADELGVYEDDAAGRIGLLQSELFRAARIVVDTGIHHKRWTREQATKWMIENAGERPVGAQREIDRYCVYPGQACSFMVGATSIRSIRESARQRMGTKFDVRDFHDLVLRPGPTPLDVLQAAIEQWAAGTTR
jgi:uncharacterized protein (DUF885 family)